ncbi:hypothetical protein, partial [uncultured Bifidobacterium sp.]|uniref:hypothetical protein n=1 Tax=uncultured Bifidobacterium sp. TaxID=165187 RepID=UPI00260B84B0
MGSWIAVAVRPVDPAGDQAATKIDKRREAAGAAIFICKEFPCRAFGTCIGGRARMSILLEP